MVWERLANSIAARVLNPCGTAVAFALGALPDSWVMDRGLALSPTEDQVCGIWNVICTIGEDDERSRAWSRRCTPTKREGTRRTKQAGPIFQYTVKDHDVVDLRRQDRGARTANRSAS